MMRNVAAGSQKDAPKLTVLYSRGQIAERVAELGAQISADYHGETVILIAVLKGATIFLSDLARAITLDCTFDFLSVQSYGAGKDSSGEVRLLKDLDRSISGQNVILVEDILDTGLTLTFLKTQFLHRNPKTFKIAALLDKPTRRRQKVDADYVGFTIPNKFVVGYGLDFGERYRNLPDICTLPQDAHEG
ncbi:MAG: hypoxanthine phosphoribosyltransferase [Acidobacteriaceae bacterium]